MHNQHLYTQHTLHRFTALTVSAATSSCDMSLRVSARVSLRFHSADHWTGKGYVAETRGQYYDALVVKKCWVVPMIIEAFGGITPHARAHIAYLAQRAKRRAKGRETRPSMGHRAPAPAHSLCITRSGCPSRRSSLMPRPSVSTSAASNRQRLVALRAAPPEGVAAAE